MNTRSIFIVFTMLLSLAFHEQLKAQNEWFRTGNTVSQNSYYLGADNFSSFPVRFKHFVPDNSYGHFEWWTNIGGSPLERMRLTNGGWLGINTFPTPFNGIPAMMLHVNNGGILSTGTEGANPDLASGTRFMWVPSRASLRAAEANGLRPV